MRLYSIIKEFLENKDYITLEYFALKYSVSKRTIYNDISYIMKLSYKNGYKLHNKRFKGYLLEIVDKDLFYKFINMLTDNEILFLRERHKNIIAYLSIQKDFISMDKIANFFQISRTSVKNEMKKVITLANEYKLKVCSKTHYGVRIDGDINDFINLIFEFYTNENKIIVNKFEEFFKESDKIKEELIIQFEKENLTINYNELKNMVLWFKAVIFCEYRNNQKDYLFECDYKYSDLSRVAWNIKNFIEEEYCIYVSKQTINSIIYKIKENTCKKLNKIHSEKYLLNDINSFLCEIDKIYNTNFIKDDDFKKSLLIHMSLLIDRLYQKISYKNNLMNEICIKYPMIFNIAIRFSDIIKNKYNVKITQDEVGFIATHFAVHMEKERKKKIQGFQKIAIVCSSGGGSAYFMKMQIESLFFNSIVKTFSFLYLNDVENFEPDLIFTIIPLDRDFKVPLVHIKELLDDEDLTKIYQVIQYGNNKFISIADINSHIYNLFNRKFFKVINPNEYNNNYMDILKKMAEEIEHSGYGGNNYCNFVMERESYLSTIYINGVAIPHPIEICANKNIISVYILKNSIFYENKEVKIIFMVSLTKKDFEIHKAVTKRLYRLMKNKKKLKKVMESKSVDELLIFIKELEGDRL